MNAANHWIRCYRSSEEQASTSKSAASRSGVKGFGESVDGSKLRERTRQMTLCRFLRRARYPRIHAAWQERHHHPPGRTGFSHREHACMGGYNTFHFHVAGPQSRFAGARFVVTITHGRMERGTRWHAILLIADSTQLSRMMREDIDQQKSGSRSIACQAANPDGTCYMRFPTGSPPDYDSTGKGAPNSRKFG